MLVLEFIHVLGVHAVLEALGKPVPLAPLLWGVACAGLLPECFRRGIPRWEQAGAEETPLPRRTQEAESKEQESGTDSSGLGRELEIAGVEKDRSDDPVPITAESLEVGEPRDSAAADAERHEEAVESRGIEEIASCATAWNESRDEPPDARPPEPSREECSVMHCELSNHAALVNAMPPGEFAKLINAVLEIFESMVGARGGVCDRLSSDGMRAFFRGDGASHSHADSAVCCALAIRARLETVSEQCELDSGHPLDLRFGINSGPMLVAFFGSGSRGGLSVAGEAAEWGVRLAGANLLYGSKILLGTRTGVLTLDCVETRPIDLLQRQLPPEPPEEVYELLALRGTLASDALERLTRYREGVEHFRARRWRQAAAALRAARPFRQNDDAIDLLLHRISEQESLADFAVDGH
jgi:class 3 adenylate cyclase